jgi:hypothetical protein
MISLPLGEGGLRDPVEKGTEVLEEKEGGEEGGRRGRLGFREGRKERAFGIW